jgi:hypothetical protein
MNLMQIHNADPFNVFGVIGVLYVYILLNKS